MVEKHLIQQQESNAVISELNRISTSNFTMVVPFTVQAYLNAANKELADNNFNASLLMLQAAVSQFDGIVNIDPNDKSKLSEILQSTMHKLKNNEVLQEIPLTTSTKNQATTNH